MPDDVNLYELPKGRELTLLYRDDLFLLHDTGHHPENAGRLVAINNRLDETGLAARCTPSTFTALKEDTVAGVHERAVIERAKLTCRDGGGCLDADTVVCPNSYRAALAAAGACVAGVDAVLRGVDRTALCLVRPPGHHATPIKSMGFCLFNNIALAAQHARTVHELDRILIVDWDVHHGNGTQDIWYRDESVFYYSIHRYGGGFYPGTGNANETGSGPGLGYNLNVTVPFDISPKEYLGRFANTLRSAADKVRPQLVLLSAGFDAYHSDPVGGLCLEPNDFATMTDCVLEIARTHCAGRVVSCLEGGYDPGALAESVQLHLERLIV